MSVTMDIAEAVKDLLNAAPGGTFSPSFTAARAAAADPDLPGLSSLQVLVIPANPERSFITRGAREQSERVYVVIQKKVTTDPATKRPSLTDVGDLLDLAESIVDYLEADARRVLYLDGGIGAVLTRIEATPIYYADQLLDLQLFTSVWTATYKIVR